MLRMNFLKAVAACVAFAGVTALAQTTVTTSGGTTNTVPLYTGSSTLGNSIITQSGTTIGLPGELILGGNSVAGAVSFLPASSGSWFWIDNPSGSPGSSGSFLRFSNGNSPDNNGVMVLTSDGYLGVGTISPAQKLTVSQGSLDFDNYGFASSYRAPSNSYTNLFLGGAVVDNGNGSYTVETDGGSNYFAAIRMDNQGGNAGAINFYTASSTGGTNYTLTNAQLATYQRMTIVGGNVGIGITSPSAKLEVDGNLKLTSGSGASITFADGTVQSTAYTGVSCGGDYAESVDVQGKKNAYEPGDVLVISGASGSDVEKASEPYSTMVAGIYSTKPGYVGRRQTTKDRTREIPMAMVGIVPTKVSAENGSIHRGDLLVTSSTPGYVMKGTDRSRMLGAVVGKAMGNLSSGKGVMEVLVTLQ